MLKFVNYEYDSIASEAKRIGKLQSGIMVK